MAIHATVPVPPETFSAVHAGIRLRLRVRFAGSQLNVGLAAGEGPASDCGLALRAAQLTSPGARGRLATAVEKASRTGRRQGFSAAIPVDPRAVDIARPVMLELAAALRCSDCVRAQGVALAELLLTQAEGPLYRPERTEALYQAVHRALLALGPSQHAEPLVRGG